MWETISAMFELEWEEQAASERHVARDALHVHVLGPWRETEHDAGQAVEARKEHKLSLAQT